MARQSQKQTRTTHNIESAELILQHPGTTEAKAGETKLGPLPICRERRQMRASLPKRTCGITWKAAR